MLASSTKALTRGAFTRLTPTALLGSLLGANGDKYAGAVMGGEELMKPKAHGATTASFNRKGGGAAATGPSGPSTPSMRR